MTTSNYSQSEIVIITLNHDMVLAYEKHNYKNSNWEKVSQSPHVHEISKNHRTQIQV
jgi:hypothetical protein